MTNSGFYPPPPKGWHLSIFFFLKPSLMYMVVLGFYPIMVFALQQIKSARTEQRKPVNNSSVITIERVCTWISGILNINRIIWIEFLVLVIVIMLEYTKLVVSILLIVIFFILFGLERIQMLKDKGVVISRFEETPSQFPSPGHIKSYMFNNVQILFLRNFYQSYTFFLFTSIMHCQYNNSNIIQRVRQ